MSAMGIGLSIPSTSPSHFNQNMGMNIDSFCIAYIVSRMHQLGFPAFNFEPYLVVLTDDYPSFTIEGQNEYYYLTSTELAAGTEISADNNYFKVENYYGYMGINKLQEFTGNIYVYQPQGSKIQTIEFIRVIPNY